MSLLEGAESEDTEDILGAGYWAQQPVWDTARSASSKHCHYTGIIYPPLSPPTSGLDSGLQKCITIYNNFFYSHRKTTLNTATTFI